jgi:hypothetical protein
MAQNMRRNPYWKCRVERGGGMSVSTQTVLSTMPSQWGRSIDEDNRGGWGSSVDFGVYAP